MVQCTRLQFLKKLSVKCLPKPWLGNIKGSLKSLPSSQHQATFQQHAYRYHPEKKSHMQFWLGDSALKMRFKLYKCTILSVPKEESVAWEVSREIHGSFSSPTPCGGSSLRGSVRSLPSVSCASFLGTPRSPPGGQQSFVRHECPHAGLPWGLTGSLTISVTHLACLTRTLLHLSDN